MNVQINASAIYHEGHHIGSDIIALDGDAQIVVFVLSPDNELGKYQSKLHGDENFKEAIAPMTTEEAWIGIGVNLGIIPASR